MRPSTLWPSISRMCTVSFSRRAWFRNTSWMFGGVEAFESRVWAISDYPVTDKGGLCRAQGCGCFARTFEPFQIRLFPEPDQLTPGVSTVLLHDKVACRRQVPDAAQELQHLPIHEAAEGMRLRRHAVRQQRLHLVQQPARELRLDAAGDAIGDRLGR